MGEGGIDSFQMVIVCRFTMIFGGGKRMMKSQKKGILLMCLGWQIRSGRHEKGKVAETWN